jgi:tetratricopeptide (TPR) repeat protein
MTRNGITAQFAFCLLAVITLSRLAGAAECPARNFTDSPATVEACTARLNEQNLSSDDRAAILVTRGRAFAASGRQKEAALDYDQAIALAKDPTDARLWHGWLALNRNDFQTAIEDAMAALEKRPDSPHPYALIGSIKRTFDFEGSRAAYQKAISLAPNDAFYHYALATLLERWAHDREALAEINAIAQLPAAELDKPEVYSMNVPASTRAAIGAERGKLLSLMGRYDEAEKAYDDAIRDAPCALTYAVRANFHFSRDAPKEIIQADIDKALALDPDLWLTHRVQASLDEREKNTEGALSEYQRAAELNPQRGMLHWQRALVLRDVGRVDEATSEALAGLRTDVDLFNRKSNELSKLGYLRAIAPGSDPTPAIRDAVQACMLDDRCL